MFPIPRARVGIAFALAFAVAGCQEAERLTGAQGVPIPNLDVMGFGSNPYVYVTMDQTARWTRLHLPRLAGCPCLTRTCRPHAPPQLRASPNGFFRSVRPRCGPQARR
jgi:hypothetical protein